MKAAAIKALAAAAAAAIALAALAGCDVDGFKGDLERAVAPESTLVVVNDSAYEILYLYVAPSSVDDWGSDWLGDATIPIGESRSIAGLEAGTYDLDAEYEDESHNEHDFVKEKVEVPAGSTVTWTLSTNAIEVSSARSTRGEPTGGER